MAIKPILFNTKMVQAILAGRKTVTRRVIKNLDIEENNGMITLYEKNENDASYIAPLERAKKEMLTYCRYQLGDILYVRETWCNANKEGVEPDFYYYADVSKCEDYDRTEWKWCPSIHMPKKAARIWLRVVNVKVERLQDITVSGIQGEGLFPIGYIPQYAVLTGDFFLKFKTLWKSTLKNSDLGCYGWDANPWVWVIEFERCEKPENLLRS